MSAIVPRDIARKLEQRWSARIRQQDESFQAKAERLKRESAARVEGVPPQTDEVTPAIAPNDA
jgi:hypothetical protein